MIHVTVTALVACTVTGDWPDSMTLSLLEPTIQAFAFFFHAKAWTRAARRADDRAGLEGRIRAAGAVA